MAYTNTSAVKAALGISDSSSDTIIDACVLVADEQINGHCDRDFTAAGSPATTRLFRPQDECTVWVDDIGSTTDLVVKVGDDNGNYDITLTINSDFRLAPYNAATKSPSWPYYKLESLGYVFPYWHRNPAIQVTARFGWPAVPDAVAKAALILAIDQFKLNSTAFGVAGQTDFGTLRVGAGINLQAAALLAPFVRAHE
jgi:hypothetical protein